MSPAASSTRTSATSNVGGASAESSGSRGRPRDEDRTEAILDAAIDLMHEVGWEGLRVQDVATRAGSGLATIYRRWPTKEALVAEAMRHDAPTVLDETGDPRTDLRQLLVAIASQMCGKDGGSILGVLAAARHHDELGAAVDEIMRTLVRDSIRGRISAVIGDDHPDLAALTDALPATLLLRAGIFEEDLDPEAYADEMLGLLDTVTRG